MLKGIFLNNTPYIQVVVAWKQSVQTATVILDTGFTGSLLVTPKMAKELGLEAIAVTRVELADGSKKEIPTSIALVAMEGKDKIIEVLIQDSMPLAGISLLAKFNYKAVVDCKNKKVTLRKA